MVRKLLMNYEIGYKKLDDGIEKVYTVSNSGSKGEILLINGEFFGYGNYAGYSKVYLEKFFFEIQEEYFMQYRKVEAEYLYKSKAKSWAELMTLSTILFIITLFGISGDLMNVLKLEFSPNLLIPMFLLCLTSFSLVKYRKMIVNADLSNLILKEIQSKSESYIKTE